MIGIIVAGHGNFATGLTSGLKLLVGEPEDYKAVDFEPEDSIEELTGKLNTALKGMRTCSSIIILTDLTGGSPFNVASGMKLADGSLSIEIAGGTNLPVVLHAYTNRAMTEDGAKLLEASLTAGKEQMVRLELNSKDKYADWEGYEE